GVLLALLEVADVEDEQPVLRAIVSKAGTEHGQVRRVPVLRELEIVPLGQRDIGRRREEPIRSATSSARAARDQLRIRSVGSVDRLDADIPPQRREVAGLSLGPALARMAEASGDD